MNLSSVDIIYECIVNKHSRQRRYKTKLNIASRVSSGCGNNDVNKIVVAMTTVRDFETIRAPCNFWRFLPLIVFYVIDTHIV